MSIKATVIIPTFSHADTLLYSLPTALAQTVGNIEIFVIGDGVPDRTREIMLDFMRQDSRVRFYDFPKGPRHGEIYRHKILTEDASGEIVCYLPDDDLWLPHHVETMLALLSNADFAHTLPVVSKVRSKVEVLPIDLQYKEYRKFLLLGYNRIPLMHFAHTLACYKKLPFGWRTTPDSVFTDLYMYQQFLSQPFFRPVSSKAVTGLHFDSPSFRDWTVSERLVELSAWAELFKAPDALKHMNERVVECASEQLVHMELQSWRCLGAPSRLIRRCMGLALRKLKRFKNTFAG